MKSIVLITDTREQKNEHILTWFDENKINHEKGKLSAGDYSFYLPKNEELGILRNTYFSDQTCVERKNSVDELVGNFAADRERLEDEFLRYQGKLTLVIEDGSYADIRSGNYRSKYNSKSAIGTLHSFSQKYNVPFIFIDKESTGCFIYCHCYYFLRSLLTKN